MASYDPAVGHKRTAILVVHGIGSQRALETVRGVIRGVWLDRKNPDDKGKRIWTHPQKDGADIDLSVMSTNKVPDSRDGRGVDFHELYWAHLMSETKAVAVLLWLYELCRKGPIMKPGMNGLWWAAAVFLCLMNLSFALLVLQAFFCSRKTTRRSCSSRHICCSTRACCLALLWPSLGANGHPGSPVLSKLRLHGGWCQLPFTSSWEFVSLAVTQATTVWSF